DPQTHELFKYTKEMNEMGFQRLFSCYDHGVSRLNSILRQDVYKTEVRIIKGRGKRDVKTYKFEDLKESIPMPDDSNKKKRDKSTKPEDNLDIHPNKRQ
ncbi:7743_t:CDS:1, partial [Racocetra fulgida]